MFKEERAQLVDEAIRLDLKMKDTKKQLDKIKATLQTEGQIGLDNQNIKQVEFYGTLGTCQVGYAEKLDVTNYPLLQKTIGDAVMERVKKEEIIKYTPDNKLKQALIAVYKGDCKAHNIESILAGIGLDAAQIKVCRKKLKGDYWKDRDTIASFLEVPIAESLEEELDAIREQINYELAEKFMDLEKLDMEGFRRSMIVEETLSVGLSYETD